MVRDQCCDGPDGLSSLLARQSSRVYLQWVTHLFIYLIAANTIVSSFKLIPYGSISKIEKTGSDKGTYELYVFFDDIKTYLMLPGTVQVTWEESSSGIDDLMRA